MRFTRRYWTWYISALFYRLSYIDIAHQLDKDLFAYLGKRTQGAIVADCGCGPGVVTEKFLQYGAAQVLAIDGNIAMLRQVRSHLANFIASGQVVAVQARFIPSLFSELGDCFLNGAGFDIILFKRSLYINAPEALVVLHAATAALNPAGILVIIHPDLSLCRYAFGPKLQLMPYTLYHLFNRFLSLLGHKLGLGEYMLYTQTDLLNLAHAAAAGRKVELIPSQQRAYNLVAIRG
jgi:SAM-dependent methyltransferase